MRKAIAELDAEQRETLLYLADPGAGVILVGSDRLCFQGLH